MNISEMSRKGRKRMRQLELLDERSLVITMGGGDAYACMLVALEITQYVSGRVSEQAVTVPEMNEAYRKYKRLHAELMALVFTDGVDSDTALARRLIPGFKLLAKYQAKGVAKLVRVAVKDMGLGDIPLLDGPAIWASSSITLAAISRGEIPAGDWWDSPMAHSVVLSIVSRFKQWVP